MPKQPMFKVAVTRYIEHNIIYDVVNLNKIFTARNLYITFTNYTGRVVYEKVVRYTQN